MSSSFQTIDTAGFNRFGSAGPIGDTAGFNRFGSAGPIDDADSSSV
jgi:hypothetical protein